MSKDNNVTADFNILRDDFKELRNDVNTLFKHLSKDTENNAKEAIFEMGEKAKAGFENNFSNPNNALFQEFKKHPIISSLVLLSIGFLGVRTFIK